MINTRNIFKLLLIFFLFESCSNLFVRDGYHDFSDDKNLNSEQLNYKHIYKDFFQTIENNNINEFRKLSLDSVFCSWEVSDSAFHNYNDKMIAIDDFLTNYFPYVFNTFSIKYYINPINIFNIDTGSVGQIIKSNQNGLSIHFGPKRCSEECGDCYFDFVKTKNGYKFYGMWEF